ncbi:MULTISPECIES: hypothetical protein [Ramlibacter]|uniref:Uncharacterized protein n=1 Tax=Ramlibacter pinisoli TaxID=2682844 RepID=A0A6N8ITA7_9BURK|nr:MULTISPECIES: hypothetical protein [Ramlibacter]MBA2965149.1 hypothetical protein [Ramlibacter sp. CGMCC 1.13660]MVQ30114.1 hypothetical protein [Ramlibacter pinisoli]
MHAETARTSLAVARILAVQRHFAEVLLASENIGVAEYRLGDILDGTISGACTATWSAQALLPLRAAASPAALRLEGELHPVPNVGETWYLVTALLQTTPHHAPHLALLSSEQDGLTREPVTRGAVDGDDTAMISVKKVFFRPEEILQENSTEIHEHLARFATFLKCAIQAGEVRRTVEHMSGDTGADARATLARTVNQVMRPAKHARWLPEMHELHAASRSLCLIQRTVVD